MAEPNRLLRAVSGGFVLGFFGAALVLLYSAWKSSQFECEFPDTEECTLELATAVEVTHLQGYAAIGCALLSGGGYLLLRRR